MIKLLAIKHDRVLIGISEADHCNEEITKHIYLNSPDEVTLMPVNEHLKKVTTEEIEEKRIKSYKKLLP